MTQEDKELLIKDISARLQHKLCVEDEYGDIVCLDYADLHFENYFNAILEGNVKPYLLPLSSMTDEMLEELNANGFFKYRDTIANVSHLESKNGISEEIYTYVDIENISFLIEFFHSHHIDYRGLIEKGLAINATGLNVY